MRRTSALARLFALTLSCLLALTACEDPPPPAPEDEPPIVGALEVAISLHSRDPEPSGALHIEINQTELQLEHHSVYTLSDGRPPASEVTAEGYALLRERIAAAPARSAASLTVHGAVPYGTMVRTVQTLLAANYRTFHFAVRQPNASPPAMGWITIESPRVVPATGAVTFPTVSRPWSDFGSHWQEIYEACREGRYIDCDGAPSALAEGGELVVELWARGSGMVVRFEQTNAPDAGPPSAGGPAMLEGVAAPSTGEEDVPLPIPDAQAVFSFRFEEASNPESHLPAVTRPVCASATCPIIIEADDETQSMRVLSLLGAVWPDGTTPPVIAFRLPGE